MNVDKGCVTHHHACDCREAAMKKLVKDLIYELYGEIDNLTRQTKTREFIQRAKKLFGELK